MQPVHDPHLLRAVQELGREQQGTNELLAALQSSGRGRWDNAGSSTAMAARQIPSATRLITVGGGPPGMVSIQMHSFFTSVGALANVRLYAQVDWQVGRGNQTAFVDIGHGTAFTLSAAQSVEVTAFLSDAQTLGQGGIPGPLSTTDNVLNGNVFGVASPCTGQAPIPASLTTGGGTPGASALAIPPYASGLTLLPDTEASYGVLEAQFHGNTNATDAIRYRALAASGKIPVVNGMQSVVIQTTDGSAPTFIIVWEIML